MTTNLSQDTTCTMCRAPGPRLYLLPERAARDGFHTGPTCYFCFIRMTGMKPTRSRLAPVSVTPEPGSPD
jgi:hypothetical protein